MPGVRVHSTNRIMFQLIEGRGLAYTAKVCKFLARQIGRTARAEWPVVGSSVRPEPRSVRERHSRLSSQIDSVDSPPQINVAAECCKKTRHPKANAQTSGREVRPVLQFCGNAALCWILGGCRSGSSVWSAARLHFAAQWCMHFDLRLVPSTPAYIPTRHQRGARKSFGQDHRISSLARILLNRGRPGSKLRTMFNSGLHPSPGA